MKEPKRSGPWSSAQVEDYLAKTIIPIRLSAISEAGWPVVVSMWFLPEQGAILCAARKTAKIVEILEHNARCGFEISGDRPPYFGVRGQAHVTLDREMGPALLVRLINRYLGPEETPFRRWLLQDADDETAIIIHPVRVMSWDYRGRMRTGA